MGSLRVVEEVKKMVFGLFGGKSRKKPTEKKSEDKDVITTTVGGAVLPRSNDGMYDGALKGVIESAAVGQPQLTEHITTLISNYVEDAISPPFRPVLRQVLHPAVLMGDASNRELADIKGELYFRRLGYTTGIRAVAKNMGVDYDLQYAAAIPLLRLARGSHLLHVAMRFGPVMVKED